MTWLFCNYIWTVLENPNPCVLYSSVAIYLPRFCIFLLQNWWSCQNTPSSLHDVSWRWAIVLMLRADRNKSRWDVSGDIAHRHGTPHLAGSHPTHSLTHCPLSHCPLSTHSLLIVHSLSTVQCLYSTHAPRRGNLLTARPVFAPSLDNGALERYSKLKSLHVISLMMGISERGVASGMRSWNFQMCGRHGRLNLWSRFVFISYTDIKTTLFSYKPLSVLYANMLLDGQHDGACLFLISIIKLLIKFKWIII